MAQTTLIRNLQIEKMKRLLNTQSGNPRFEVTFTDGTVLKTDPDSAHSYDWANLYDGGRNTVVRAVISDGVLGSVQTTSPGTMYRKD